MTSKIPKIIHFFHDCDIEVWQKSKTPQFRMCYMSWKRFCPDYKIMHWHDKMPEFQQMLKSSKFLREVYKRKMWALVSDYVRYYALYNYGGIYLDTDVEIIKNFDEFLDNEFFCSIEGTIFDNEDIPEPAVIGGIKKHHAFKDMLEIYNSDEVFKTDYPMAPFVLKKYLKNKINFTRINYNETISQEEINQTYKELSGKTLNNFELYKNQKILHDEQTKITIYPSEYFCPRWNTFKENSVTLNTSSIHWNQSSWWGSKKDKKNMKELNSLRYNNWIKRLIYLNIGKITKFKTLLIFNKEKRKMKKEKLRLAITNILNK